MNANWTNGEKAILREVYASGKIVDQMHRLPGRTISAVWRQAAKLGLKRFYPCDWSPEEDAVIREAYATGTPLKVALKNLPGRTHRAIRSRAADIGLSGKFNGKSGSAYSWVAETVKNILAEGVPMSSRKIAMHTDASLPSIQRVTGHMHGKEIYVADWEPVSNGYAAIWMLGDLEDAPKPTPVDNAIRCREYRRNLKVKRGAFNPFAAAAGLIEAPKGNPGRVYIHLTDSKDDEYAEAA